MFNLSTTPDYANVPNVGYGMNCTTPSYPVNLCEID